MACMVMAYTVTACIVMAYIVMAYIVMAIIVMAAWLGRTCGCASIHMCIHMCASMCTDRFVDMFIMCVDVSNTCVCRHVYAHGCRQADMCIT